MEPPSQKLPMVVLAAGAWLAGRGCVHSHSHSHLRISMTRTASVLRQFHPVFLRTPAYSSHLPSASHGPVGYEVTRELATCATDCLLSCRLQARSAFCSGLRTH